MTAPPARRKSAEERREEVVAVALEHFALEGYRGTSTEAIARDAGISQPYLFRLFGTKKELFLACHERSHAHLAEVFRRAAAAAPEGERLRAMGTAYAEELLPDRHQLLFQMQSYAATSDPDIQSHVRSSYGELVAEVARLSGAGPEEVFRFFAHGMLLNVIAALDLPGVAEDDEWARAWTSARFLTGRPQP